jgi:hypothetical protein
MYVYMYVCRCYPLLGYLLFGYDSHSYNGANLLKEPGIGDRVTTSKTVALRFDFRN